MPLRLPLESDGVCRAIKQSSLKVQSDYENVIVRSVNEPTYMKRVFQLAQHL